LYSADQGIPAGTNTGLTILIDNTTNNNHGVLTNFAMSGSSSNYVASSIVLPVSLTGFTLARGTDNVVLHWQTSQEQNSGYIVERSGNGTDWDVIGQVKATAPSMTKATYSYSDELPLQGINYYRLKEVNVNSGFTYSNVIYTNFAAAQPIWLVLQNPVQKGLLQFTTNLPATAHAKVQLFDAQGRLVLLHDAYPGLNTLAIPSPVRGIYFLGLFQDGRAIGARKKIIVE
jgi:hypothetical protein